MMKRTGIPVLLLLSALGSTFCAGPNAVPVPPVPEVREIDWNGLVGEADSLAGRGHYAALLRAFELYGEVMKEPTRRGDVSEKYLKTAMALSLREKDLGIPRDETLLELDSFVARDPSLAPYASLVELLSYLPVDIKGSAGDNLPKGHTLEDQIAWITDRALPLDEDLEKRAKSDDVAACLRLALRKTFFFKFPERLDPGLYADIHPDSRLVAFRAALSPNPDEDRLNALLGADREFFEAHYFLGELNMSGGKLLTAEKHYASALEGIPEFPSVLISLAKIAFQMEELQPCLEYNERALELVPTYRDALLGRALCLGYLGRNAEAIDTLGKILELGFRYIGEAHYWTAWNFREQGRLEDGRRSIDAAKTFLVNQPDVLLLSGMIAYGQGRLEEAERELLRTLTLSPDEADAAYHLGRIYADTNRWADSGAYFSGAAGIYGQRELALEKKIQEVEASELAPDRKARLIGKKRHQIQTAQATKATCQFNAAAGYHNAGNFAIALEMAELARTHPSFAELAADLIKMIKDRIQPPAPGPGKRARIL